VLCVGGIRGGVVTGQLGPGHGFNFTADPPYSSGVGGGVGGGGGGGGGGGLWVGGGGGGAGGKTRGGGGWFVVGVGAGEGGGGWGGGGGGDRNVQRGNPLTFSTLALKRKFHPFFGLFGEEMRTVWVPQRRARWS